MKTLTATLAALAAVATLSAAPAMAGNSSYEQQAKLQRILNGQPDYVTSSKRPTVSKHSTSRAVSTTMLTGPEKAQRRLRRSQPVPSGR